MGVSPIAAARSAVHGQDARATFPRALHAAMVFRPGGWLFGATGIN
ncbi:hypothetical protein Oter_2284 [Opitutus terrae PB90-1]|uniref:Uncharacterized protein n=1 Tax=Opitutus terrae (strain DSM 11246 / JCM 15787 / PB90-1) TaxID=452637 RepID=B1ZPW7_OPITP|nr:hypothetical protein Oter_2284 [Opitutus terrae PB90-1]